ncbi:MAG: 2-oxo acid dehydrogenase subunit E2 [Pirellulaceae bacterium]|nr:2-oxo acid dehydrogenase subunit E2 [Pirellulaceae bacterium]
MPVVALRVPQLGEGLREALLIEFLKQPGQRIERDEPIYIMETDKATSEVESPCGGQLLKWLVQPGTVVAIGTEIAQLEVTADDELAADVQPAGDSPGVELRGQPAVLSDPSSPQTPTSPIPGQPAPDARTRIPPRTRKMLRDTGLSAQVDQIPVSGSKMLPTDVDAYLAASSDQTVSNQAFDVLPLAKSQISLNYRLSRSAAACIPVTVVVDLDWTAIQATHRQLASADGPTEFALACWSIVQTMKAHSKFRSALSNDGRSLKTYRNVHLGVAVALPDDQLVTATIHCADSLTPGEFFNAYRNQVQLARQGVDQADESITVSVSNIGKVGIRLGIPVIVAPAVATLVLGELFQRAVPDGQSYRFCPTTTAALCFDHRVINGAGAASFIGDFRHHVETLQLSQRDL